jgi:hypothetical protein
MSKIMLNEIVRIQEIMLGKLSSDLNKTKQYLFEAVGGWDDVIEAIVKSFDNKTDDLFRHTDAGGLDSIIAALKSKFPRDLSVRNIDNPKTLRLVYNELDGPAKQFITKSIIKNSTGGMDNSIIEYLTNKVGYTLNDFEQYVLGSTSVKQLMDDMMLPEYYKGIITRYFKKVHNIKDVLNQKDIEMLTKAVKRKGVTTFFNDISKAYKSSVDEITSDIEKLNKEYIDKISSEIYPEDQIVKLTDAYSLAISRKLNMIEMKLNEGAENVLKTLNLDTSIMNKIKNGEEDIFRIFRNLQMQNYGGFWDNFMEVNKSFIDSITPKLVPVKIAGKTYSLPRFNMSSEFKQFLLTGQWAKFSDLYLEAVKSSALGKTKFYIGNKTFNISNFYKYGLKILYKSGIGAIMGAFLYAVVNTLLIQFNIKIKINNIAKSMGLREPYPNAEKEYIQSVTALGGVIPQLLTQVAELLGNVEFLIPIVGSFDKSFAANLFAYLTGTETAGISVKGIVEIWNNTCDAVFGSDEEDEIEQAIQETPTPNDDEVINKAEDKKNEVIGKIDNTPEGFENFIKSKGLTLKTAYIVDGVGQTNEPDPDPNGAKSNNWYFDKNTNTFISY